MSNRWVMSIQWLLKHWLSSIAGQCWTCLFVCTMMIISLLGCSKEEGIPACQESYWHLNSNIQIRPIDTTYQALKAIVGSVREPLLEINLWLEHVPFENYLEFIEYLQFLWFPCSEGIYHLADTNQLGRDFCYYGHAINRDLGGYIYDIVDDDNSYLEVLSLDTINPSHPCQV